MKTKKGSHLWIYPVFPRCGHWARNPRQEASLCEGSWRPVGWSSSFLLLLKDSRPLEWRLGRKKSRPFQVDADVEWEEEPNPGTKPTSLKRVSSLPAARTELVFFQELSLAVLGGKAPQEDRGWICKGLGLHVAWPPSSPFPPTGVIFKSQPISLASGAHRCVPALSLANGGWDETPPPQPLLPSDSHLTGSLTSALPISPQVPCCVFFMMSAQASVGTTSSVPITTQTTAKPPSSSTAEHTHPVQAEKISHEADALWRPSIQKHVSVRYYHMRKPLPTSRLYKPAITWNTCPLLSCLPSAFLCVHTPFLSWQ